MLKYVLNRQRHWSGIYLSSRGRPSGTMVQGKLSVPGRSIVWMILG